jgi:phosphoribosylformimino-5-aminoimidazole carboxamide ribotide isomerase
MQVIPAIDLQHGRAVRLLRGDFAQETVYGNDPVEVARRWHDSGASLVHVVDLDGSRRGRPAQLELVGEIAETTRVQLGGGLRTRADIEAAFAARVARVVLGTAALDRALICNLVQEYGDRLVVALDTRAGRVTVRGWTESSEWTLLDLARNLIALGAPRFLHTDVERDGALTSPNFSSLASLVALGTPVIASGGVAHLEHIRRLREIGAEAVIVGRALYEGTVDLREAMALAG